MHLFLLSVLITVTAQGRASAPPDVATVSFTIATDATTASAATSDNNARYERLMKSLTSLGIARSDISTTYYNLNYTPPPQVQQGVPQEAVRYGYFVNRTIQVTLHHLDLVGKTIDNAVASGVTDIGGVSFGVNNNRAQYAQALRSAVEDARAQAQAMAQAEGLHIIRVKSMQQGSPQGPTPLMMAAKVAAPLPAPPTEIEPSSVEATANVTITYEAQ